jgi:hypothetical protein
MVFSKKNRLSLVWLINASKQRSAAPPGRSLLAYAVAETLDFVDGHGDRSIRRGYAILLFYAKRSI